MDAAKLAAFMCGDTTQVKIFLCGSTKQVEIIELERKVLKSSNKFLIFPHIHDIACMIAGKEQNMF